MNRMSSMINQQNGGQNGLIATGFKIAIFLCFVFFPNLGQSQNERSVMVKGFITNQNGEPLPEVTVAVKGGQATTTLPDGSFQIQAPVNATILISYVGYINKEIRVGSNDQTVNLQLLPNRNELNQVVVVGYGTRKRSDVTGAIVSVSEQSIKDIATSNLASALQGQAAGVDIQRSGANSKPGATPNILIRGSRSLGASNSPLIVIDGIPFNGNINDINQDDVSSVEILKDASSTAIYGSRGANGVILISTKRGRSGKPVFTYNGYVGTSKLISEFPVMNAAEFTDLKKWANIIANPGKYTGLDDPTFLTGGVFDPAEIEGLKTVAIPIGKSLFIKQESSRTTN